MLPGGRAVLDLCGKPHHHHFQVLNQHSKTLVCPRYTCAAYITIEIKICRIRDSGMVN